MTLKSSVRDLLGKLLYLATVTHPASCARNRLVIATFHRCLPEAQRRLYPCPGLVVTPDELRWFLSEVLQHYRCSPLADAYEHFMTEDGNDQPRLALTFDDGQLDNFVFARPVLQALGVTATFYIPSSHVDTGAPIWHDRLGFLVRDAESEPTRSRRLREVLLRHDMRGAIGPATSWQETASSVVKGAKTLDDEARSNLIDEIAAECGPSPIPDWARMMDWTQLLQLADDGHEIGSHTLSHCFLPRCDDQALMQEVVGSKQAIERRLSRAVRSFCYPNGDSDLRTQTAVRSAGYLCAVTTRPGSNLRDSNPTELLRYDINPRGITDSVGRMSSDRLFWRLSGLYPS
jgi:peptidoglycan/xylan/chitin deacetylase (PgdA/CDA1 family)